MNNYHFSTFGYNNDYLLDNKKGTDENVQTIIDKQITPLEKIIDKHSISHDQIQINKDRIEADMSKYNDLLGELNDAGSSQAITINVGSSTSNTKVIEEDIDTSYERLVIPPTINKNFVPAGVGIGNDVLSVEVEGKTIIVRLEHTDRTEGMGWPYELQFSGTIERQKNKKYYHSGEDTEFKNTRLNQREQMMKDTKDLLLYNNQLFIAGTITSAIALILTYRLMS